METTHTPGPWIVKDLEPMKFDEIEVSVQQIETKFGPIATVIGSSTNAQLIAAAPETARERDDLRAWKKLYEGSSYGGILKQLQRAEDVNAELLEALKSAEQELLITKAMFRDDKVIEQEIQLTLDKVESAIKKANGEPC